MKISVVTVCYNSVNVIEETINSVLEQTYGNVEYIIIDGGSTDGTVDIIKKYADQLAYWISEPDKGIYDAMNKGIAVATGDYINFMNAGDSFAASISIADFVSKINKDTVLAYGDWIVKYHDRQFHKTPLALEYIKSKLPFCHQATFISIPYHKIHRYSTDLQIASDYKFVYDAVNEGVICQYIPVMVAVFDSTDGVSSRHFMLSTREKFKIWGIEHKYLSQLPWYLATYRMYMSYGIRKILPPFITVRVKMTLDRYRKHQ